MHLILDPRSGNGRKVRYPKLGIIIGSVSGIIGIVIIGLIIFIIVKYRKSKANQKPRDPLERVPPVVPPRLIH